MKAKIINNQIIPDNVLEWNQLIESYNSRTVSINITEWKDSRTLQQLRYINLALDVLFNHKNNPGYFREEIEILIKEMTGLYIYITNRKTNEAFKAYKSFGGRDNLKITKDEAITFIEYELYLASEWEVPLMTPEEYYESQ